MIDRLSRASLRTILAMPMARRLVTRLRRSALLGEDIVPFGVHRFDRQAWVIKETAFGARIWCSLDERSISRPILLGTYEPAEVRFIASAVKPGDLAVDAGANIGYHALHLAKLVGDGGFVEMFEPLPYLADALEASIAENGFGARTQLRRIGLDERAGTLRLRHAPRTENFGGGHFAPDDTPPGGHADEVVATARLDDIIGDRRCRFIKIDVEGAEPRVIRGAMQTLATGRPVILSELHERQLRIVSGAGADDFIAQMAAAAYRCSHLNADGTRGAAIERYSDATPLNVVFDPVG
jgi:FkbM family methyltransferase